jgi:hypothetical protein
MNDPVKIEEVISADSQSNGPDSQMDIIHVLRSAQAHHVSLSSIADQKANIVLGSFLVFLTVTQSLMKANAELSMPLWVLTIGYTIAAVFALLVITPRFRDKSYKKGAVPGNLLFFGSFGRLSQDEYVEMLSKNLQTDEDARRLFMKDIYQIGQVLQKKYQNLRRSYVCLAAGIVAALIALTINSFL